MVYFDVKIAETIQCNQKSPFTQMNFQVFCPVWNVKKKFHTQIASIKRHILHLTPIQILSPVNILQYHGRGRIKPKDLVQGHLSKDDFLKI